MDHLLINESFTDIARIGELAHDWDLEFQQMQAGPLTAKLFQQVRPGFHFGVAEFSRCIKQEGIPPLSGRSFAVLRKPGAVEWCGHAVGYNDLMAFHPTMGFSSLSQPGFCVYTVTLPEIDWQRQIQYRFGWTPTEDFSIEHVLRASPLRLGRLRSALDCYYRQLVYADSVSNTLLVTETDCVDALFDVIAASRELIQGGGTTTTSQRAKVLRKSCELIYAHDGKPVTLTDLCAVSGVSERTVQYAFLEHTGQSPKKYIRSYRLECVRRELQSDVEQIPITAIASRWGFVHMGQFARYYRQQFGELPSETRHGR